MRLLISCVLSWSICAVAVAQTASAPSSEPAQAARLETLGQRLDAKREELHIPGCALVVVHNDQIILLAGFGLRDLENNLPVTEDTLFAIGSSSKAFTATLIGMLVDDGKLNWDDPVRTHLPDFKLHDPEADEKATIRDLLCHRIGLDRTDLAWAGGKASIAEVLAAARRAEPVAKFREAWHYQNIMFLAAGEAAANAAGTDFETLLDDRLFKPLGMSQSNMTLRDCEGNPQLSNGYQWDEDDKKFVRLPMRDLRAIAPAGAINSTARDMAQWLRLQLGRGEIDGKRLISDAALNETWTKHSTASPGMDYGLGWFLRDWRGKKLVEHGGNIDGFAAQVALLPDENLGFALLTNVSATPLQGMAIDIVFDSLLGELNPDIKPLELAEIEKYLGKYHFDAMKLDMTVLARNGKMAVDVPGQMVFDLKPPDAEGKWAFDFPAPIQVSFVTNEQGDVTLMKLYQSGLEFELPREGVHQPIDISLDDAKPYLGVYHSDDLKWDVTVKHQNGRVAVDVPGQMVYELHMPDADGQWAFRAKRDITVKFDRDADGQATAMTMFQEGKVYSMPRTGDDASAAALPTLDEVIAKARAALGSDRARDVKSLRLVGDVNFVNQGIAGSSIITCGSLSQLRHEMDFGVYGSIKLAFDGQVGASHTSFQPFNTLKPKMIDQQRFQSPLMLYADWRAEAETVELQGVEKLNDREVYIVRLASGENRETSFFIDAETGLITQQKVTATIENIGAIESTITYEDWRDVNGLQIPFMQTMANPILGKMTMRITATETNMELPAGTFTLRNPAEEPKH